MCLQVIMVVIYTICAIMCLAYIRHKYLPCLPNLFFYYYLKTKGMMCSFHHLAEVRVLC